MAFTATTQATNTHFTVRSSHPSVPASDVALECDELRQQLLEFWQPGIITSDWHPKCQIEVHATRGSYLEAVGRGGAQTLGCASIEFSGTRVVKRRIDLLLDSSQELSALPHELTHVLLADMIGRQPPRWLDEGIATMADSPSKRQLHQRDAAHATQNGTALRLGEILTLDSFTHPEQVPAFYGQSLSLAVYLARRKTPADLIAFTKRSMSHGYDRALRECYGLQSLAELEREWAGAELALKKQNESQRLNDIASDDFR